MQFASFSFAVFLCLTAFFYFKLPQRFRWLVLLTASILFYASYIPSYLVLAAILVGLDFWGAQVIERVAGRQRRISFLALCGLHLLILAMFKYTGFIHEILSSLGATATATSAVSLLTPIGLSYQTLMSISYLNEVNAGRFPAVRKPQILALYLLFFPQLQAGPIERPQNTIAQFEASHEFDYARVTDGLRRMALGFFKKLVIADQLAIPVNTVYGDVHSFSGPQLTFATLLFGLQIYADFAGYTDIALGTAKLFGIKLTENFRQPYFARSVTEFWQRWHISLSTWLRDYLYFPLARKLQVPSLRWLALLITFVISGLWHGAAWTFILWGTFHGLLLAAELVVKNQLKPSTYSSQPSSLQRIAPVVLTYIAISFSWIFFRSADLGDALYVAAGVFTGWMNFVASLGQIETLKQFLFSMGFGLSGFLITLASIPTLFGLDQLETRLSTSERIGKLSTGWRWAIYYALVTAILLLGAFGKSSFVYFQF